ncbi:hypothetical protein EDC01DRAFT_624550 [Geopyxis carbonaria]|nr:hypothetical protein EDC01DRAFT_624550 [Geopyxis carbonaria]
MATPTTLPQIHTTASDRGPALNLIAWITLVCTCLAALTKVFSKSWKVHQLSGDSGFILLAMVLAVGQTVAVTEQVDAGLGKRGALLEPGDLEVYQKAAYASQLLYLPALAASKLATLWFIATLARTPANRAMCTAIILFTLLWTVAALFTIAFQCPLPHPWATLAPEPRCINASAFWAAIGSIDILLQLALIALPVHILWGLQMPWSKKAPVMAAFAARALVIPLTVLRIAYIHRDAVAATGDPTFDAFDAAVVTAIGMTLDVALACLPFLRTFMDAVQHGVFTADLRVAPGHGGSLAYALGSVYGVQESKGTHSGSGGSKVGGLGRFGKKKNSQSVSRSQIDTTITGKSMARDGDGHSRASSGHDSCTLIIKQSTTLSVQSETVDDGGESGERERGQAGQGGGRGQGKMV